MTAYDPKKSAALVAEAMADEERMTPGNWKAFHHDEGSYIQTNHDRRQIGAFSYNRNPRDHEDSEAIASMRNRNRAMAEQLRAALELIDRQARHITILVMDQRRQLPADTIKDIADSHHERDSARSELERMRLSADRLFNALDLALGLADTPEHQQDEDWHRIRKQCGATCDEYVNFDAATKANQ
jgi:hypothetical protein